MFQVVESEKEARVVITAANEQKVASSGSAPKATLEELFTKFQAGEVKELRLIVKADVQGSLEPIVSSLRELDSGEIKINVLHAETGNVSESDVMLAAASKAIIVGFNVQADADAKRLADGEGASIRLYEIIYRLIEDVEKALKGMLEPEFKEVVIGQAAVLAVFKASKLGSVAGCKVVKGEIHRNARVRVMRGSQKLYDGDITSLRHEKEDEKEIRTGFECGIGIKGFNDFEAGDVLECYRLEKVG